MSTWNWNESGSNLEEVDVFDSDEMQKLSIDSMSGGISAKRRRGKHSCMDHGVLQRRKARLGR